MSRFLAKKFEGLKPYTPGEQPQNQKLIKLNTNESPFPPSPKAVEAAITEAKKLNLYSDPACRVFLSALSEHFGVGTEQVFASNGSDEVLAFLFQALSENGAAFADQTYGFYPVYCNLYGVIPKIIPLKDDFSIDPKDYYGLKETIFIANPNAPTGLALSLSEIRGILDHNLNTLVVIDEAYVDFGAESAVPLLKEYDNLLIVGTFSKSRSMAGARLGYAVGSEELIADLNRIKFSFNPYNVNRMTLAAAAAAIRDRAYFEAARDEIIKTRTDTIDALRKRGYLCTDSKANFIFVRNPDMPGKEIYQKLRERDILVRWFDIERIRDWLRITVGTREEMDALLAALKEIGG